MVQRDNQIFVSKPKNVAHRIEIVGKVFWNDFVFIVISFTLTVITYFHREQVIFWSGQIKYFCVKCDFTLNKINSQTKTITNVEFCSSTQFEKNSLSQYSNEKALSQNLELIAEYLHF